jgi:hypothetical protein
MKLKRPSLFSVADTGMYTEVMSSTCKETAQLLTELMNSATTMHQLHLSVSGIGSFAAHKALNEYYDAITDLIDNVAEQYQGAKESLLEFPLVNPVRLNTVEDAVELLRGLHEKTTSLQRMIPFSEVVNQLDEVKSLIASTKYKLLFLK